MYHIAIVINVYNFVVYFKHSGLYQLLTIGQMHFNRITKTAPVQVQLNSLKFCFLLVSKNFLLCIYWPLFSSTIDYARLENHGCCIIDFDSHMHYNLNQHRVASAVIEFHFLYILPNLPIQYFFFISSLKADREAVGQA